MFWRWVKLIKDSRNSVRICPVVETNTLERQSAAIIKPLMKGRNKNICCLHNTLICILLHPCHFLLLLWKWATFVYIISLASDHLYFRGIAFDGTTMDNVSTSIGGQQGREIPSSLWSIISSSLPSLPWFVPPPPDHHHDHHDYQEIMESILWSFSFHLDRTQHFCLLGDDEWCWW